MVVYPRGTRSGLGDEPAGAPQTSRARGLRSFQEERPIAHTGFERVSSESAIPPALRRKLDELNAENRRASMDAREQLDREGGRVRDPVLECKPVLTQANTPLGVGRLGDCLRDPAGSTRACRTTMLLAAAVSMRQALERPSSRPAVYQWAARMESQPPGPRRRTPTARRTSDATNSGMRNSVCQSEPTARRPTSWTKLLEGKNTSRKAPCDGKNAYSPM